MAPILVVVAIAVVVTVDSEMKYEPLREVDNALVQDLVHVPRAHVQVAHNLAKFTSSFSNPHVCFETGFPSWIDELA